MRAVSFDRLEDFIEWAAAHEQDKIEQAGFGDEFDRLAKSVARRKLDSDGIDTFLQIVPVVGDDLPDTFFPVVAEIEEMVGATATPNADVGFSRLFGTGASAFRPENLAEVPDAAESAGQSGSDGDKEIPLPQVDDPRALVLPMLRNEEGKSLFINGYNPVTDEIGFMAPELDENGDAKIIVHLRDQKSGKFSVAEWDEPFFKDGNTFFFAHTPFDESSVFAVRFDPGTHRARRIERYPSYAAAGFEAPFRRSIVSSKPFQDKPNASAVVKVFTDEKEYVSVRIFENERGEIENVTYRDFANGALQKGDGRLFGMEYYAMPREGLKISFKKKVVGSEYSVYQAYVYHDTDAVSPRKRSKTHLSPVPFARVDPDWINAASKKAEGIAAELIALRMDTELLRDTFYEIRDTLGMPYVAEVLMQLYYGEDTQMHVVNVLRRDDVKNLPVPPDTRIFPGSRDLISSLISYFGYSTSTGFVSRQLLQSAEEMFPQIPTQAIRGLWLYAARPTMAEAMFLNRGAATPEDLTEGHAVGSYRRILDDTHSPFADTSAARQAQRERLRGIISGDSLNEGFRQYMGYQIDLAENYDLFLLESGSLYYGGKMVHAVGPTEDGDLRVIVDYNKKIVDIPHVDRRTRSDGAPLALSPENIAKDVLMAPTHPDDPFLFTFKNRVRNRIDGNGGSFDNGNMLLRGKDGLYHVPTAAQVYDSMKGLLPLPRDYLAALLPNPPADESSVSWIKKGEIFYDLKAHEFGLNEINLEEFPKLKMVRYAVKVGESEIEVYLPKANSKLSRELRKHGYYVASEADLTQLAKYYLAVTRKGFMPERANIYIMPGLLTREDGGILGFYTWKTEDLVISSDIVGPGNDFKKWAAIRLFNTARHEIAHSIKRGNPWITSLMYRAMALDGFTMDYGNTHLEEYFAVLYQHFFDHPIHRRRFPNGYRLLYNLIKMKEAGIRWDGPHHVTGMPKVRKGAPEAPRNIDGTYGALRVAALGGDPYAVAAKAKRKRPPGGGSGGSASGKPVSVVAKKVLPKREVAPEQGALSQPILSGTAGLPNVNIAKPATVPVTTLPPMMTPPVKAPLFGLPGKII